ncbi:izumo sperm-egg fusion protein 2 [Mixophyes fleayi]|uniref:izumo sperm-egg fusion protein 2 n=1 Tax=Mixophyes fleayi TaxID=3061075 RepID=UPI003F4D965E
MRKEALPNRFRDSRLRNRCEKLVKGMESNFFKDYAANHFTGLIETYQFNTLAQKLQKEAQYYLNAKEKDQEYLDSLVTLRKKTTLELKQALQDYHDKACSATECGWLKMNVYSCTMCTTVPPSCLSRLLCMVDKEKKISLRYKDEEEASALLRKGLLVVGISAIILFLTFPLLAYKYRRNTKLLTDRTMESI